MASDLLGQEVDSHRVLGRIRPQLDLSQNLEKKKKKETTPAGQTVLHSAATASLC